MQRRTFINQLSICTSGVLLGSSAFAATSTNANNKIVLALIGCGGRGRGVLDGIIKENENVEVKYFCDVNETLSGVQEDIARYKTTQKTTPRFVTDMRRVFDDKEVDAVVIATPEHWHALASIWALQAGKHVYVEKNPTLSIWEGQKLVEAAGKYKKVLQVGFQNRSAPYAHTAKEYIASGKLGNLVHVKCYNMLSGGKWEAKKDSAVPKGLNWDAWQGPAPHVPYNANRHSMTSRGGWLDFWAYGGGALSDDASHVMDLARLALGDPSHPRSVYCTGGNIGFRSAKETPEFLNITYDYGDYAMTCESGSCTKYLSKANQEERYGTKWPSWQRLATRIEIHGTDRIMYLGRHGVGWQVMEKDGNIVDMDKGYFPDKFHQKNFIDAIRKGDKPNGDALQGHLSASLVHLAHAAYRSGNRHLLFDAEKEVFTNVKEANDWLKGSYHPSYAVPEKV